MFHPIPTTILTQMKALEALDAIDRQDGTPRSRRLRQITPDTGRFLALLAAGVPAGAWVEIGTNGGLLVADNLISHRDDLLEFIDHVMMDERVDSLIVPVGKGEMVCRKS